MILICTIWESSFLYFIKMCTARGIFKKNIILFLFFFINFCTTAQSSNRELFNTCMETFSDEKKCDEFVNKSKNKKEQLETSDSKIFIRKDLKNLLDTKTYLYVREIIGDPEETMQDAAGRDHWIYKRPICRYSPSHPPDKEFTVIFKKGRVSQILHKPPE